ncbi:putative sphingolipid transporter spinster-like protein 2 [Micractinium conductrix]|uniref:Sphingolipid transporter spinster-like protein 2 n=1 Tax=Micractinium conductrix TaxID=554055 RepID=A0A2P6VG54_9CHLO|nr:putative sphingolipid transporter spinster-like protein 2 [Micractinium conductrix]|eukprot:PSC73072.1 putative sphingolipid transporter spinster-like protein 2 [Micractinium conductrix]
MAGPPLVVGRGGGGPPLKAAPAWASPGRLLAFFCTICLFIYLDRGMIASNGVNGSAAAEGHPASGIQGDFALTLFEDGLLPAAFMIGLLASSPIFAEASKHHNAFRLIGIGLAVWTVAAAGCGLAPGFGTLLVCRAAVGVGEASFVALAAPFIDDNAPPQHKTLWLGLFYCCIPTGYAFGYIFGGLVGGALGWRAAFLLEAAAMLPFVAFCLRAPPISLCGVGAISGGGGGASAAPRPGAGAGPRPPLAARLRAGAAAAAADLRVLLRHAVYVWTVGGMTAYTAVLGAFAFYGPRAGQEVFGISPERADLTFGAITVVTGTLGTLAGGLLLDRVGASMRNALLLCAGGIAVGSALAIVAFAASTTFTLFALTFAAAELAMFGSQAPSNAVCLWSVPPGLRPFAMSMSVVAIHVLGDVPSPPLLGALQGRLQNWRLSMSLASGLLLLGSAAYLAGSMVAAAATDYREVAEGGQGEDGGGSRGGSAGNRGLPAGDDQEQGRRQGSEVADDEEEADRVPSPDRPLLPSGAARSG